MVISVISPSLFLYLCVCVFKKQNAFLFLWCIIYNKDSGIKYFIILSLENSVSEHTFHSTWKIFWDIFNLPITINF